MGKAGLSPIDFEFSMTDSEIRYIFMNPSAWASSPELGWRLVLLRFEHLVEG